MRRVAVLAGYAPSIVIFRGNLVRDLVARGHSVLALAPHEPGWRQRIESLGACYEPVQFSRARIDPLGDLALERRVGRLLSRERIDTLLSYTIKPVVYGIPAAYRAGVTHRVALITGLGYAFGSASWHQRVAGVVAQGLYRRALRSATAVRFQNPDDRDDFVKAGLVEAEKTGVVNGSGVDLDAFPFVAPRGDGHTRFLLIARLIGDKGIREFAAAAKLVRASHPGSEFHIVGPEDTNPTAIPPAELNSWRREGVVAVHPPTDDVRPHLASCDVYVLPSYREGTPRTVLEAMATGRPIITTNTPGCRETTVNGYNGYLVPARDVRSLAQSMVAMIENPALRVEMGRRSRQLAEEKYDVKLVNRTMMAAMGMVP